MNRQEDFVPHKPLITIRKQHSSLTIGIKHDQKKDIC